MSKRPVGSAKTLSRPPAVDVETTQPFAFVHINKCGGTAVELALGLPKNHMTALEMRDRLGEADWANRFTFAVVRNPFARAVSIYFYRVRTAQTGLGDRRLNINQWVEQVWYAEDDAYIPNAALTAPAYDWVSDGEQLIVDDVLKLETLETDWDRVADQLGVSRRPEFVNANSHPPYRDLLTPASRKILERAFAKDMDQFGYAY